MDYCHNQGLAHRDLKCEHIFFDRDFNLKVGDFAFAGPIEGKDGSGFLTTKLGTRDYKAPEIHEGRPYKGSQVDVFALGVIMFILVQGRAPF